MCRLKMKRNVSAGKLCTMVPLECLLFCLLARETCKKPLTLTIEEKRRQNFCLCGLHSSVVKHYTTKSLICSFICFMALKHIEDKSAETKDRRKYENEKRRISKDGCVWWAGPSCVVGQGVEGGEGLPDKPTGSTWVPLTLYICRASATCLHCLAIWWLHLLLCAFHSLKTGLYCHPLLFLFRCRRASAGAAVWINISFVTELASLCRMSSLFVLGFYCSGFALSCIVFHFLLWPFL